MGDPGLKHQIVHHTSEFLFHICYYIKFIYITIKFSNRRFTFCSRNLVDKENHIQKLLMGAEWTDQSSERFMIQLEAVIRRCSRKRRS